MTVATSVVVVAVTAVAASVTHLIPFVTAGSSDLSTVASIVVFTVPGVVIGGQLGPILAQRVEGQTLLHRVGWLSPVVAALTLAEVAIGG